MTTTYIVTNAFAASILEIKNPWLIVNADHVVGVYEGRQAARNAKATGLAGKIVSLKEITIKTADMIEETEDEEIAIAEIATEEIAAEEISFIEEIVAEETADMIEEISAEEIAIEEATPFGFEEHGLTHCPVCGTHLSNGVGEHGQEVNGKPVKHARFKYCCLACGVEFGPAIESKTEKALKAKVEPKNIENRSTVKKPCRLVWDLADAMVGASRKDVIAAAEAKGVAYYTARTQYQLWTQVQKEMAAREKAVTK